MERCGEFTSEEYRIIHSGGEKEQRLVMVILDKMFSDRVTKIRQHSDRLILVRIKVEPVDLVITQVPTSDAEDEEIELKEAVSALQSCCIHFLANHYTLNIRPSPDHQHHQY